MGICSLGITHLEMSSQGWRGLTLLLRSPALPHPPGASMSSACGRSHGSGLLNIPPMQLLHSVSVVRESLLKYKTGPVMSPSTLSGCPRSPRRGLQGPGLLASFPPSSPRGLPLSCAGLQAGRVLAGGCVRYFCSSLSAEDPSPSRGPGARAGHTQGNLRWALSPLPLLPAGCSLG